MRSDAGLQEVGPVPDRRPLLEGPEHGRVTFAQLAELVGYSREWVRLRLVSAPEKLYRIGRRYQVPKGTAEEFIRSIFV